MKKLLLASFLIFLGCNATQKQVGEPAASATTAPVTFAASITEEELKTHLYTYASDEFEGRETGEPGQKKAVAYLQAEYKKMGVPAAREDGEYAQEVPLEISNLPSGTIDIAGDRYELGEDFLTTSPIEGSYESLVFAGYGIEDGDYSDYTNLDVAGKVVLIRAGEPMQEDGTYLLSGNTESSVWSNMSEAIGRKSELLVQKGARAILYFDDANYQRYERAFDFLAGNENGRMQLKKDGEETALVIASEGMAERLLPGIVQETASKELGLPITFSIKSNSREVDSENVVAIVRGSKKPQEYIVISSHLDHVGVTADGQINNGADDDGSGTVAMLEIAEAFKQAADAGEGPERSIVFLHVTGEEKGLLGSEYYTDVEPLFPLSETVANLNIDMIGRTDPKREGSREYIYLIGSDKLSSELHQLSEDVNARFTGLELDYAYNDENDPNRFYYRSDHYNFAKNNIPIIFYFNGTHEDYHRPSDTPDKINYDLLKIRAQLIFHTAWELANREGRLQVDKLSR